MKTLVLFIMMFSSVAYGQFSMPNPQQNGGPNHTDAFSKSAVDAGMSVVLIGFPSYLKYTNTNHFHSLSSSKQDLAVVSIFGTSAISGIVIGKGVDYVKNHKKQIKRGWKRLWR